MDSSQSLGFVGLGRMGFPMARRLFEAGHLIVGFDAAVGARDRAEAAGMRAVPGLGGFSDEVAVLILMLPDSNAVEAVLDDAALLGTLRKGTLVVDMSSSEPLRTRRLAARLADRGLRLVDAPVSGGVAGAERGTLTIMAGGGDPDLDELEPLLAHLGRVVRAGQVGAGHAVKALNNLLSATHLWVTSEAILAGERFGLDPEVMLAIFNTSSGRSGSTENKWPNFILPGTFDSGFGLRLMLKDMRIAVDLAAGAGAPSALGAHAVGLWSQAAEELPDGADHTEIARWLGSREGAP